jgi:hypothetical protein
MVLSDPRVRQPPQYATPTILPSDKDKKPWMAVRIDLTLDCANPTRLAEFWELALGYEGNEFCVC